MSELEVCTAALFLSKGKEVVTKDEFSMAVFMDLRWMSKKSADAFLKLLSSEGVVTVKDGYVRPAFDVTAVRVPVAFKPSDELKKRVNDAVNAPQAPRTAPPVSKDVFSTMKGIAAVNGIDGKEFMSRCRSISRSLGVTQTAAGLVVLNEAGIDVSGVVSDVEKDICDSQ